MERGKLMDMIRKLQAKADSSEDLGLTEEAEVFAGKVQELLLQHKLTMSEVMFRQLDTDDPIGEVMFDFHSQDVRATKARLRWREILLQAVCDAHFCTPFITKRYRSGPTRKTSGSFTAYQIVGRESDREICTYMLAYLINTAEQTAKQAYRKQRRSMDPTKGFKVSFYNAFAITILERYQAMTRKVRTEGMSGISSSMAIVRLDQTKAQLKEWVAEHMGPTHYAKSPGGRRSNNFDGHTAGQRAGQNVDLKRRGVKGGRGPTKIGGGS